MLRNPEWGYDQEEHAPDRHKCRQTHSPAAAARAPEYELEYRTKHLSRAYIVYCTVNDGKLLDSSAVYREPWPSLGCLACWGPVLRRAVFCKQRAKQSPASSRAPILGGLAKGRT